MSAYGECPRCGQWALEHLKSHSHCWECNYFPGDKSDLSQWQRLEFRGSDRVSLRRMEEERILSGGRPLGSGFMEDLS